MKSSFSSLAALACGVAAMPGFLLQQYPGIRGGQVAVFILLALFTGRRVKLLPPFIMAAAVIAANAFIPNGKVLLSFVGLKITAGALTGGILKATALIGMIYISRISIYPELRLPGTIGWLIFRAFAYFEQLNRSFREDRKRQSLLQRIDAALLRAMDSADRDNGPESQAAAGRARPGKNRAGIAGAVLLLSCWVPLVIQAL